MKIKLMNTNRAFVCFGVRLCLSMQMWLQGWPAGECGEDMLVVNEKRERKYTKEVTLCKCVQLSNLVVVIVMYWHCQMHNLKVNKKINVKGNGGAMHKH